MAAKPKKRSDRGRLLLRQKSLFLPRWVQGAILRGRAGLLSIIIYVFFHFSYQECIFSMFEDNIDNSSAAARFP